MTFTTRNRSQLLGTQVINQNTGERIGVVSQIWLDAEPFQVSILSVSQKLIGRVTKTLQLEAIPVLGPDALLVPETILGEAAESNGLMRLVGTEVITEAGVKLGKIKDFTFRIDTGEILNLTLSNLGIPLVPGLIASTFQMSVEEVMSLGGDAILVKAGAEDRLERLSTSLLEQVGLVKPAWLVAVETPALPSPSLEDDEEFAEDFDEAIEIGTRVVEAEEESDLSEPDDSSVSPGDTSLGWDPVATEATDSAEASPEPLTEIGSLEIGALVDEQFNSGLEAAANLGDAVVETAKDMADQAQDVADAAMESVEPLVTEAVDAAQANLGEMTETGAAEDVSGVVAEQVDAVSEALLVCRGVQMRLSKIQQA
ncbi:MAG: hypothetical protein HC926_00330 [Synechococcaceae cyanobacterium SM2_3_60]|nr:hypothetical protein [Synechococcaceae cyanobacterium SM2_3_60]